MAYDDTTAFLQSVATDALNSANNNASRIWGLNDVTANLREPNFAVSLDKPDIGPPPTFGDLFDGGDNTDPTIQYLNAQSDAWVAKYFPSITGCLKTIPDEWLCGVIGGTRPFGIDSTVFDLVWHNARDRAYRTANSETEEITAAFSARGFSLPPGALVDAIARSEERASDTILEVNIQQAIKDADIKNELLQFAVAQSIAYKTAIMGALVDFYRTWLTVPDKDIERARIKAQAMSALYSALSAYYNVEIRFEELRLRAAQTDAEIDLGVDRNRIGRQGHFTGLAGPFASAVGSFANIAAQAAVAGGSLTAEIETI